MFDLATFIGLATLAVAAFCLGWAYGFEKGHKEGSKQRADLTVERERKRQLDKLR